MDAQLFESFEEKIQKEVSSGEFKNANTHRLKRRYAEYYVAQRRKWQGLDRFSVGYNPIEKFKDIPSLFTISLYQEYMVIGPAEKEGIKHPYSTAIKTLLGYVNRNLIHPYLLDLLDRGEYPFYDNHIVIELIDHRGPEPLSNRVLLHGLFSELMLTPSLVFSTNTDEEKESLLVAKTSKICLDPSPEVFETLKLYEYNLRKMDNVSISSSHKKKVHIFGVIKEYRRVKGIEKKEITQTLDRVGHSQHIYRTAKFIGGPFHYTINAIASHDHIEVVFRKGELMNTAVGGFISKRKFISLSQIEMYIESIKKLLEITHMDLKFICDISVAPRKNTHFSSPIQRLPRRSSPSAHGAPPGNSLFPETPTGSLSGLESPHGSVPVMNKFRYIVQAPEKEREPHKKKFSPSWEEKRKDDIDDFNFDYVNKKFI
ncbi:hypothetical protein NEFER03_1848 [Nematocida sp. LUAm3]|nr:hypothetical protein NEFER03_1848 [Nematocida sp. LUAm3]KAI5174002.1 hypothetical protein NEFER02_0469 [Nematocida sp. LUAm2]KAI5177254.1 hypothetical protein NEFER01_0529 [Nematocida sp. LUAm1]